MYESLLEVANSQHHVLEARARPVCPDLALVAPAAIYALLPNEWISSTPNWKASHADIRAGRIRRRQLPALRRHRTKLADFVKWQRLEQHTVQATETSKAAFEETSFSPLCVPFIINYAAILHVPPLVCIEQTEFVEHFPICVQRLAILPNPRSIPARRNSTRPG